MPFFVFLGAIVLGGGVAAFTTKKITSHLPSWVTNAAANIRSPHSGDPGGGGNAPGPLADLGKLSSLAISAAGLTQAGLVTTQNTSGGGGGGTPPGGGGGGSTAPTAPIPGTSYSVPIASGSYMPSGSTGLVA